MRLTQGSAIQASKKVAAEAEQLLAEDPDIASYTTYIGRSSPRFWLGLLPVQPNEALGHIVVVAKDVDARERVKARIETAVSGGALSAARVRVDRLLDDAPGAAGGAHRHGDHPGDDPAVA